MRRQLCTISRTPVLILAGATLASAFTHGPVSLETPTVSKVVSCSNRRCTHQTPPLFADAAAGMQSGGMWNSAPSDNSSSSESIPLHALGQNDVQAAPRVLAIDENKQGKANGLIGRLTSLFQKNEKVCRGTITHLANFAIAALLLAKYAAFSVSSSASKLSLACVFLGQVGLIYDNAINGMGKFVGEGNFLRKLHKYRVVFHMAAVPLLAVPVTEIAAASGLLTAKASFWLRSLFIGTSFYELLTWSSMFHRDDLQVVDLRNSKKNQGTYLPGTLTYTSGKLIQLVLPAIMLVVYELVMGLWVLTSSSASLAARTSGMLLALTGGITFITSGMGQQFPTVQLYGENVHGAMLWSALLAV